MISEEPVSEGPVESPLKDIEDKTTPFIIINCSSQKEAEVAGLIAESQQRVETIVNKALLLEAKGIQAEFGIQAHFDTFQAYLVFLEENGFVVRSDRENPRFEQTVKLYLARHWERAKDQINLGLNRVKSWDDFWRPDSYHMTPSQRISFASEAKMYPYKLHDALMEDDIKKSSHDYGRTDYATHTSVATGILNEGRINSPYGANFACSALVYKFPDEENRVYVFNMYDLLKAVPMAFGGNSTTAGENEITTWFPVPLGLARAVLSIKQFLKNDDFYAVDRSGYYQGQLTPEMFSKKMD